MRITLSKIDESNFIDCFHLQLADGQEKYVSHPIRSLAQAYVYYGQCTPFGIFADGKMVGYVMVVYDREEAAYNIWHMMIDRDSQGRGCGREALKQVLGYISARPFGPSRTVLLTCSPENEIAYRLYRRLGFTETGRADEEETELGMELPE